MHEIIFEADTKAGKLFDVLLIISILLSVAVVLLDGDKSISQAYGEWFYALEWFFTILFTAEYILRFICVGSPLRYARSFFGIIDLLALLPTYLSIIFPGSQYFIVIRILRVLRIFRVLKLVKYLGEAKMQSIVNIAVQSCKIFLFFEVLICRIFTTIIIHPSVCWKSR